MKKELAQEELNSVSIEFDLNLYTYEIILKFFNQNKDIIILIVCF